MRLDELKIGQKATIKSFDVQSIPLKLIELGCLPGNEVILIQTAPLGCPLYFLIDNTRVVIRKEIAKKIEFER